MHILFGSKHTPTGISRWIIPGMIIILALVFTSMAWGKDTCQPESIIVTAEKRKEDIRRLPAPITAFTGFQLEDAGAKTIIDIIEMIPGMMASPAVSPGRTEVSYRGIGYSAFTEKNPVVVYLDGIPFDSQGYYDLDILDVERVEVLRGPQGTLYGKNALGGVINVISRTPGNQLSVRLKTQAGENGTYQIKAGAQGPVIKDKLYWGLSATHRETEGFLDNEHPGQEHFDNEETKAVNLSFKWTPSDKLTMNLHAGADQKRDGAGRTIASSSVRYHEWKNPSDKMELDGSHFALNLNYDANIARFNSTTTLKNLSTDYLEDRSWAKMGRYDNDAFEDSKTRELTQEFRIQSTEDKNSWRWMAGVFFSDQKKEAHNLGGLYHMADDFGYDMKYNWPYHQTETTGAFFAQTTFPLMKSLNFTAGLRYERVNKNLDYKSRITRTDTGQVLSAVDWSRDEDWDSFLPKGVLSWEITSDAMVYASIAKGYLAGGLNNCSNDDKNSAHFDAQTAINYELGTKTAWVGNRLFLNTTLFYADINDMHVWQRDPETQAWLASNAARAHSQGLEIEAQLRPMSGLDLAAATAWTESEFDEHGYYNGNTTMQTPEYTFNLWAQYRHTSGYFIRGDIQGYGKTYYDESNTIERKPFELYHLKVGYEAKNWDIYLYADNLLDKEYFSSMAYGFYTVGAPRTLGLIASLRF